MTTQISARHGQSSETIDQPVLWEPSIAFLKFAIAFVLAGCVAFEIALFIFAPDQTMRALTVLMLVLITGTAWFFLSRGMIRAVVLTMGIGTWGYITFASFFFGGVNGTSIIIYPLTILLTGWLVSTRAAVTVAWLTTAATLGFVLIEWRGLLPVAPPTPPAMRWIIQGFVFVLTAVLISSLVRAYRGRLAEVRSLGSDLVQRTVELQAREADLNRAQAVAHVGSWVHDLTGDKMHLSVETCRIFGLPEGTTGSHQAYLARVHPEDSGAVNGAWQAALKEGACFDNEHRIKVGQTIRWVRQRAELVCGAGGAPLRAVGTTQDITERKRHEAEVLAARGQLQATLDAIPDLLFEVGLDGRYYDYHSPRADLLAAPLEKLLGNTVAAVLPPDAAGICMSALHEAHEKGRSHGKQYELPLPQGRFWFELSVSRKPVAPGQEPRFIVLARDVTERKRAEAASVQLEAQLHESQKMEALGTLAGGIAHDFNNALMTLMGNLALARQDVGLAHPAQQSLEEIAKAGVRAQALVQQILAFARRQVLERSPIPLAPVLQESVRLLRATLPAGLELRLECAPDAPVVMADATQIQQVLINLCTNAWQAIEGQERAGVIDIRLHAHIHAPGAAPDGRATFANGKLRAGSYACLSVRDTGPGMDEETRQRIFEPFFTTKAVGKGTGLGLAVVHGILQGHDASIEVGSARGGGTIFRIYFPAADAMVPDSHTKGTHAARKVSRETPVSTGAGKHILYIDDDESIVFLMTRFLERRGYRVSGYVDPGEALAAVRADPGQFDLAVTDYNMPGMSGLQVAQALREIRADLPVALASGYITEELRAKAPAAGVRELIYKPNTVEDLCEMVARLAKT